MMCMPTIKKHHQLRHVRLVNLTCWLDVKKTGRTLLYHTPHCCRLSQLDDKHLLIFGGLDKRARFNDAWVYDWDAKDWAQVQIEGEQPAPRAHFTATKFGSRIFVFGGYGGDGQVRGLRMLRMLQFHGAVYTPWWLVQGLIHIGG